MIFYGKNQTAVIAVFIIVEKRIKATGAKRHGKSIQNIFPGIPDIFNHREIGKASRTNILLTFHEASPAHHTQPGEQQFRQRMK